MRPRVATSFAPVCANCARFPLIGDVRGLGLMTAMDLARSASDLSPNPELRETHRPDGFRRGLLLLGCGESAHSAFCPPLCITAAQVDVAITLLQTNLNDLSP